MKTPLMLLGDGPQEATGLGRIARDLGGLLAQSQLPIDFVQVGGHVPPVWAEWRHYPLDRAEDWGAACCEALWRSIFGGRTPGILFLVWDPGRLAYYRTLALPVQKWAYTAIDSTNIHGSIGGPAAAAVADFDRVLAYGRWGSTVLRTLRPRVSYLPHGLDLHNFTPSTDEEAAWVREQIGPYWSTAQRLIGGVATNQPRKDLGLYCHALSKLRERGHKIYGWLHLDVPIKEWAIQQLIEDFGLARHLTVTLPTLTDRQLACLYAACSVTIAPGLGEGFGYPLVESLAAGTPVVHGDFGGGRELIPKGEWRFPVRAVRLDSIYAMKRPVFDAEDVANAIERVWQWQEAIGQDTATAYCRGSIAHLDWRSLWPRWEHWIRRGLNG